MEEGKKESEGKLMYEIDWIFLESMAKRLQKNKGKYEPYNWKRKMDKEELKQALLRHTLEVMKGMYDDEDVELDHLPAIATNAMMLWHQLKFH